MIQPFFSLSNGSIHPIRCHHKDGKDISVVPPWTLCSSKPPSAFRIATCNARLCGMLATHVYKDIRTGTWLRGLFAKYQTLCGLFCTSVIHRRAKCLGVRLSEVDIKVLLRLLLPAATVQSLELQQRIVRMIMRITPKTKRVTVKRRLMMSSLAIRTPPKNSSTFLTSFKQRNRNV